MGKNFLFLIVAGALLTAGCIDYWGRKIIDPELGRCDDAGNGCGLEIKSNYGTGCSRLSEIGGCYARVAIKRNDRGICQKAGESDVHDYCLLAFAKTNNDTMICESINSKYFKGECYFEFAQKNSDLTLCNKTADYTLFQPHICALLLAKKKNDAGICEAIEDKYGQGQCLVEIAKIRNDMNICEKIDAQERKDECFGYFAKEGKNATICEKIIEDKEHDHCLIEIAGKFINNQEICGKLKNEENKENCYFNIAINTLDVGLCELTDRYKVGSCISNIAQKKGEPDLCFTIPETYVMGEKQGCIQYIAVNKKDITICDKLPTQPEKQGCIDWYAFAFDDPILCEMIVDLEKKEMCLNNIEISRKSPN